MFDFLTVTAVGIATALWRVVWLCLILPIWRVLKWAALVTVGAWSVNRLEHEYETGAYHS